MKSTAYYMGNEAMGNGKRVFPVQYDGRVIHTVYPGSDAAIFEFFVFKNPSDGEWSVTEWYSGLSVATGKTKGEAIRKHGELMNRLQDENRIGDMALNIVGCVKIFGLANL